MGLGLLYILKINPCPVQLSDIFLKKKNILSLLLYKL